ncbi:BglG family transcription antiterminator [Thorsellia anophelis]|uniref:Lichenan operon transcriptional antiterminator n=1 Tax=Thorsellia anophelis DSM 18579 TaxID=1123402 RepID=A0A1I0F823_9GAMM|nr:PTS sugar transporter subunit IIA [Thorsellia anophelis]SET53592.1 lichenan operon transcriptional antiterminator [Thorsellia anophelis DSM 18579]
MNTKLIQLISTISKFEPPVTAKKLGLALNVSPRTIKNYVSAINTKYAGMIKATSQGYEPDTHAIKSFLASQSPIVSMNSNERVNWILTTLLKNTGPDKIKIDIDYFSELLFISEESIRKDLFEVRQKLQHYDLHLVTENSSYTIRGEELNKRKLFSTLLNQEFSANLFNFTSIKTFFPNYDIDNLSIMIIEKCKLFGYSINEYALLGLIIDILISIDRISLGKQIDVQPTHCPDLFGEREKTLATAILYDIESLFSISFNQAEIFEFNAILANCLLRVDYQNIDLITVNQKIGQSCTQLVNILLSDIEAYDFIDSKNPDFIIKFSLHINQLLLRIQQNTFTKNPITQHIKFSCPLIFECAIDIASRINEHLKLTISEDEVGYIALHLGSMLIEQTGNKIRCILISPAYHNTSEKLITKLSTYFNDSIVISGFFSSFEQVNLQYNEQYDLIISTLPIPNHAMTDSLVINPIVRDRDISQIKFKLDRMMLDRKKDKIINDLLKISTPDLFFINQKMDYKFETKKDVIIHLTTEMIQAGCVNSDFQEAVFEREKNYSTRFGQIAVPHSMKMDAIKTSLSICICPKPINWDEGDVNLILLFAIAKEDRMIFYDIFDNLLVLLLENQNLLTILPSQNFNEFIQNMKAII